MPPDTLPRRNLTPPQLARRYGVSADKVLAWIRSGELRAVNAATRPTGRPRRVIDPGDVVAFEQRRAARPTEATTRRRSKQADVIEFF
jgi:hypothetical protein